MQLMYGKYTLFMNPLKTGDIYTHAQTVYTRPLLGGEGPGEEARSVAANRGLPINHIHYTFVDLTNH